MLDGLKKEVKTINKKCPKYLLKYAIKRLVEILRIKEIKEEEIISVKIKTDYLHGWGFYYRNKEAAYFIEA